MQRIMSFNVGPEKQSRCMCRTMRIEVEIILSSYSQPRCLERDRYPKCDKRRERSKVYPCFLSLSGSMPAEDGEGVR